ncbi:MULTISPECIES: S8 family peptidase [Streptomyces]|uniref:S8 family peptidase n=1 Tax=Streptomyces tsukubensis (strain DSM 42081 / NBRC 108919 / NRRL 18488 / 9993) TaxID=1114943 RepID=I2NB15_STRT9|nr:MULTISPECIES: S8 family peptidase [Streptomyces]AZK97970.1 peptidase S8 [Streptomyces tsukubensis]EIF94212.1 peptidase S8 and S53 subtilisin kexin sedolisin [Streptomyces tsukubensis NRRL18488]MYS64461.1 S8 family serine peptidase [Streptomyces sp. SID5473]QKM66106.1 S8 family peptidase [Streptomyces tsukubensis NRRL18488]TAI42389.1 S8 family peptidase [Streptomyces tsukubensis]
MKIHSRLRACAAAAAALLTAVAALSAAGSAAAAPEPGLPANGITSADPAPLRKTSAPIPGQYIVTLHKGTKPGAFVKQTLPGLKPLFTYAAVLNGFAAKLTPAQLRAVRAVPAVKVVEEDGTASARPVTSRQDRFQAFSWGLDRIDQPYLPLNQKFNIEGTGVGATAYIVDTGIDYSHPEFGGRAVPGFDAVNDGRNGQDCNGHGTHVAGTVGGTDFGVARQAKLVSVRVLGCDGRGPWSGIIAGLDWVAQNARRPAVINASLGGDRNQAVNNAVTNIALRGTLPVVAAGNDARDACDVSPASAQRTVTVGATDHLDKETDFSNFGPCLSLYAPGKAIFSAKLGGGSIALDGTSMASPHVAGVALLYQAANPAATPEQIADWLVLQSTKDILTVSKTSPNRLLYTGGL